MTPKITAKEKALSLRRQGKTYNEILAVVPVAKSTLSLWLRAVGLSQRQQQRITAKRYEAQKRGGMARKIQRLTSTRDIFSVAKNDVGSLSNRERLLIGAALYWAEGAKEKVYRPSVRLEFANSDPEMIRFYVRWLRETVKVSDDDIILIIHLHKNHLGRLNEFTKYWLGVTGLRPANSGKPVIKLHNPKTKRKNTADTYHGLVNVRLRKSTNLNRRTQGWIYGIISAP